MGMGGNLPRILICKWVRARVFRAGAPLQSVYSRRWKNTAVYGASQVQTTIYCILFAITRVTPQNIGLLLWKARFALAGSGSGAFDGIKVAQLHRFHGRSFYTERHVESVVLTLSGNKAQ